MSLHIISINIFYIADELRYYKKQLIMIVKYNIWIRKFHMERNEMYISSI